MTSFDSDIAKLEDAMQLFAQAMKRPQRWTQIVARSGIAIDRPAASVLHTLILHEPKKLRVQDLALQLGIEPPSVTRKTQELEQAGYLRRRPDPQDRRAISLEVTPAGHNVARQLSKVQRDIMSEALTDWPSDERHQFISLFERFSHNLASTADVQTKHVIRKDT